MKKFLAWTAIVLVALLLLLWFGGRWVLGFSVADYQGEIDITGLQTPVDITFDSRGIPQIWASNEQDLYFALGWMHASERLFQMELVRRLSSGRLSELFGRAALGTDKFQRTIGFARKAESDIRKLPPEQHALLQAYCKGINTWVDYKTILPPEFVLLRITPEEWTPEDCLTIAIYQTWYSHSLRNFDGAYRRMLDKLGGDILSVLQEYKTWSPPTIPAGVLGALFQDNPLPLSMALASNSWVVAPEKSTSGAALHASDPHLQVNAIPGFWYAVGLHSPDTQVLGITAPGLPFVAMGHNERIAWAFTVAAVDMIDRVHYRREVGDSLYIRSSAGRIQLETVYESIYVKDQAGPVRIEVQLTPAGPVIQRDSSSVTALHWAGQDFNGAAILQGGMALHQTRDFPAFRRHVTSLGALDANWTYSDADGNIGYQLGVPVPVRSYSNTIAAVAAEDTSARWNGYLSLEEAPYAYNPPQGWLATCNNQIRSPATGKPIPGFYDPYRITRATALLSARERFSAADMGPMQMDPVSGLALRWKTLLQQGAIKSGERDLAERIAIWDGSMNPANPLPTLFTRWWYFLAREVFEDELGEDWRAGAAIMEEVISRPLAGLVDNTRTPNQQENLIDISAQTLQHVLRSYEERTFGEISSLTINHPVGQQVAALDWWLNLNRGPFPVGGDEGSLNANFSKYDPVADRVRSHAGASMRYVLDWAAIDDFSLSIHLGQSGNPFSPHYDDFLEPHLRGDSWRVPFSKDVVYSNAVSVLTLK